MFQNNSSEYVRRRCRLCKRLVVSRPEDFKFAERNHLKNYHQGEFDLSPRSTKETSPAPDLAHSKPSAVAPSPSVPQKQQLAQLARTQGYEPEPCRSCREWKMVRKGTCLCCSSCGETTGCS